MSEAAVKSLEHASIPTIVGTGLLLGVVHVLTGPDHLSALIVLSAGSSWRSCQLGMRWGCGHSAGLILVTAIFLALDQHLDIDTFGSYCDFFVGFLMIFLGLWSLRHYIVLRHQQQQIELEQSVESQPKEVTEVTPLRDLDAESNNELTNHRGCCFGLFPTPTANIKNPQTQRLTAFAYGTMHGLAGTGGILGMLPAVILNDWARSSAYLSSFCGASILIMGAFAALYGEVTGRMSRLSDTLLYRVGIFSSCVSLVVGIMWVILVSTGTLDAVFG